MADPFRTPLPPAESYAVPEAVQAVAIRTLAADAVRTLANAYGQDVATVLATGTAPLALLGRMRRFFAVNRRQYDNAVATWQSGGTSDVVRSWDLHGGSRADAWVSALVSRLEDQTLVGPQAVEDLFAYEPQGVFDAFTAGAWRHEYGLTPQTAARFAEDYQRATGWPLDLERAFGESGRVVRQAMWRRTPRRASQLVLGSFLSVTPLREAALADFRDVAASRLDRTGFSDTPVIAHYVLACEHPALLPPAVPAPRSCDPLTSLSEQCDAVRILAPLFHPQGRQFHPDAAELGQRVMESLRATLSGEPMLARDAQALLEEVRAYQSQRHLAAGPFRVYLACWRRGWYNHLVEGMPPDAEAVCGLRTLCRGKAVAPSIRPPTIGPHMADNRHRKEAPTCH